MPKTALITGITGQDGSYLAEFLLARDYKVTGLVRKSQDANLTNIDHIKDKVQLIPGDLLDESSLESIMESVRPDEIYNLAAQASVFSSWEQPILTAELTAVSVTRLLEAMRCVCPEAHFYQASSSEMFGSDQYVPQNETSPFKPRSPYGVAKLYGHWITANYRESHGMFTCSGILFNHESPRRALQYVSRKVTHAVASIKLGLQSKLKVGNLDAKRDWGFAGDYVEAMWLMLQNAEAEDFVIATGVVHSVRDLIEQAFACLDMDYREFIETDPALLRPTDPRCTVGDSTLARRRLGWVPKIQFNELVRSMVNADLRRLEAECSVR